MLNIFGRILKLREDSLQIVMHCRPFYRSKNHVFCTMILVLFFSNKSPRYFTLNLSFLRNYLLLIFSTKNLVSMMPNKSLRKRLKIYMTTDKDDRIQKVFLTAKNYTHKMSISMCIVLLSFLS